MCKHSTRQIVAYATVFGTILAMARSAGTRADLLQHPLLTTGGLFVEAHAGHDRPRSSARLEAESGLSMQWFEVLIRLARSPGHRLRMTDLAAQTTLIRQRAHPRRRPPRGGRAGRARRRAPTDRRSTYAVLTPEGERRDPDGRPGARRPARARCFDRTFTPEELETFTDLAAPPARRRQPVRRAGEHARGPGDAALDGRLLGR